MKIYITRKIPQPGLDLLKDHQLSIYESDEAIPKDVLIKNVPGIDALLCMLTDDVDKSVIEAAGPGLKVIATMSVGFEHIDVEECKKRKIRVCNTPNVSTDSVAELTVSLLLLVARRLLEGIAAVKKGEWGKWKPMWLCGIELTHKTIGILGLGRIGYGVACRVKPFGVKEIIYHDVNKVPYADDVGAKYVDFETMAKTADCICICCNLTPETQNKFNKATFKMMKKEAILINSGRGGVIHHDDLYDALVNNEIKAAGLDVTEPEPLPANHKLISLPNCIITPHMGSNTCDSRNHMAETASNNILSVNKGEKALGDVYQQ